MYMLHIFLLTFDLNYSHEIWGASLYKEFIFTFIILYIFLYMEHEWVYPVLFIIQVLH